MSDEQVVRDSLVLLRPTNLPGSDATMERNALSDLRPVGTDGEGETVHVLEPESILLRAIGITRNNVGGRRLAQQLTCILYALDQMERDLARAEVFEQVKRDIKEYWTKLPKIPEGA